MVVRFHRFFKIGSRRSLAQQGFILIQILCEDLGKYLQFCFWFDYDTIHDQELWFIPPALPPSIVRRLGSALPCSANYLAAWRQAFYCHLCPSLWIQLCQLQVLKTWRHPMSVRSKARFYSSCVLVLAELLWKEGGCADLQTLRDMTLFYNAPILLQSLPAQAYKDTKIVHLNSDQGKQLAECNI